MIKKLFIVKKEVLATSISAAEKAKGKIFAIEEASEEFQPNNKKPIGFKNEKK
jgi:hypothetical protein